MSVLKLTKNPVHLGLGASAAVQPDFTGAMEWYVDYAQRAEADGVEGRLVSMHTFSESWGVWEMHPMGSELVVCTAGSITLIQERVEGSQQEIVLNAGDYALNAAGVWHTADVESEATVLFITAGLGTEHRPR